MIKAIDIFNKLVLSCSGVSDIWRKKRKAPGALVTSLSSEEREVLSNLSSDDVSKSSLFADMYYWCDDFFNKKEEEKIIKDYKKDFDKKLKKPII